MKVLLANLPWISDKEIYGVRAGSRWPHLRRKKEQLQYFPFPFSLAYAAAVLEEKKHNVFLKDCIAEEIEESEFRKYLKEKEPQVVVFETSTPSIYNDLRLTHEAKKVTGAITVLCGQHATALPEELLQESYVDYTLPGEYEYALRDLIHSLENGLETSRIKGVCAKRGNEVIINERAALIPDLDILPYPAREVLPMAKYVDPFCKHIPNVPMLTSRGCPYQCTFCLEPWVYYGKPNYRMRSAKNVVDEMEYLIKTYSAQEIYFDDSSFSVNQKKVMEISEEIKKRNLKVWWSCMADAKLAEETLVSMKDAGCVAIKFGVESANPEILKNVGKHINLDEVKKVVKLCRKIGIETHATYMFGLPGESKDSMRKTAAFAFGLKTDTAQFSVAIPYPGTKFFEEAKKNRWLTTQDWTKYSGDREAVVEYPQLTKEEIAEAVHRCRKKIMVKIILNPRQLFQYVSIIYKYSGIRGLFQTVLEKFSYLIRGLGQKK